MDKLNVSIAGPKATWSAFVACLGSLAILAYLYRWVTRSTTPKGLSFPPGPKPRPIIGNLYDFPSQGANQEVYWSRHRDLYGPISHLSVFGKHIIVINDADVAKDILEKRSNKHSGRPVLPMAGELVGFNRGLIFSPTDSRFREMRKVCHNQIGSPSLVSRWQDEVDVEVRQYLLRTLKQPEDFLDHVRREAGTIILKLTYGYETNPHGSDPLVDLAAEVMASFAHAAVPGYWLVDTIPALKYIPAWFPGASFKKIASLYRKNLDRMRELPYEFAKQQFSGSVAKRSVVAESLRKLEQPGKPTIRDDDIISHAAVNLYAGGADTTVSLMEVFYLAMLLHPDTFRKAQQEIDSVVGNRRLPEVSDRANLPFVEALIKEVIRWEPIGEVVPPHATTEDDVYGSYFIPKGTMILVHIYGIFHNPKVYSDPFDFRPERFLGPNAEPDVLDIVWGFGKRICPGRHLAVWNIWLQISRTIAVFDIKAVPGQLPVKEFTSGLTRRPVPFKADIKARSEVHERLIRAVEIDHPLPEHGDGDLLPAENRF